MTRLLLGICVHLLVCAIPAFAQSNQSEPPILVIGTQHAPPFAMKLADGSWDGVSVELWREIASDNNWDFEFLEMEPGDLIAATQRGDVDAAVAATAVTSERERVLDFSHPFYSSGLGIAVRKAYRQDWGVDLIQLLARQFLSLLAFFITVTVCIGGFMWLAERQHNPDHFGGDLVVSGDHDHGGLRRQNAPHPRRTRAGRFLDADRCGQLDHCHRFDRGPDDCAATRFAHPLTRGPLEGTDRHRTAL